MFSSADKTVKPSVRVQRKTDQTFFGSQKADKTAISETTFFQPSIQLKLKVNQPDDNYEKEADLIAESVVNMPEQNAGVQPAKPSEVQRQVEEEEEEELQTATLSVQRKVEHSDQAEDASIQMKQKTFIRRENDGTEGATDEGEETLQTFSNSSRGPPVHLTNTIQLKARGPPAPGVRFQTQLQNSTAGGQPMTAPVGSFMSSRFGADFSSVRIHTDASAQQMSKQVNAHAFTYGNHIYFNSGKYDPDSTSGRTLLAHELTHTIQQGAVPVQNAVQRKHAITALQRKTILQRQVAPQLTKAVKLAEAEQGKVIANKEGPDGNRYGWERLMEYFETTLGKDKIVSQPTGIQGVVYKPHIKKKSIIPGMIPNQPDTNKKEKRDAMPSWCGIFAFWALNKAGIPMPKWKLGEQFIPPEAAYPSGYTPKPGDLAFRQKRSHYGLVVGMDGPNRVKSVNGNTAGDDNLGGEVQVQTHDLSSWQGYFNPLVAKTGSLRDSEFGDEDTEPKTFRALRKLKYNVSRKADDKAQEEALQLNSLEEEEERLQTKPEKEQEEETIQRLEAGNPGGFDSNGPEYETEENIADIQTKPETTPAALVRNRSPGNMIQGGWLGDAWNAVSGLASDVADLIEEGLDAAKNWLLDKVRDFVKEIPGYTLLSYILGYDPITGRGVDKTPLTLLNAVLDLIPIGGTMVKWVLDYFEATNPVAVWLFDSVKRFFDLISNLESRFENFWNGLSINDVGDPEGVMNDVANLFKSVVTDIVGFVSDVGGDFLTIVTDIAVRVLANFVKEYFPNAYDLLTILLGEDPVTKEKVDRNGTNILNAGLKVLGERGALIKNQMVENGIFDKCAGWIDRSIELVLSLISDVGNIFDVLWGAISFESLFTPIETFTKIAQAFITPISRIVSFITDAMVELLAILRDALTGALSNFAKNTRGYFLITVLIGKDPFTGIVVPRNTENIIHGFFSLMDGGEAQFQQMKESGAIDRMTEKISKAVGQLNFTLEYVLGLFTGLWESMDWNDFLNPFGVFRSIINTFADPVIRLIRFIVTIVKIAIEILMVVMNFPIDTINNILQRTIEVFGNIKRDPVGFLKNLLRAIKQGFTQFFDNILSHLMSGLASWLFGSLGTLGIQPPADLSFKSILNLILQILGISAERIMERVWLKLTQLIGAEKVAKIKGAVDKLTGIWTFIKDVIERGPVAIWEFIQEKLSNLWTMVLDAAKNWIITRIIASATTKLLGMLDPTGIMAVINSVIAIYKAIQSFIEQLRAMLEIFNSFVNGVAEIAAGNVKVAADYLEGAMARGIPVLIGFLANQVGLGGIGRKMAEIIGAIREKITEGIDWLVAKALRIGRPVIDGVLRVIEFGERVAERGMEVVGSAREAVMGWLGFRKQFNAQDGTSHALYFSGTAENAILTIASEPKPLTAFLNEARDKNTDDNLNATIAEAINLSTDIDGIKVELNNTNDDAAKQRKLNDDMDRKMAGLIPLVSKIMGGNEKSVGILEKWLNKKVTRQDTSLLARFRQDINKDINKVNGGNFVYRIIENRRSGREEITIARNPNMAQAGFMRIYINEDGILLPGSEKVYIPDHKNYIPEEIKVSENDGVYKAVYLTKTFDGSPGPVFRIEISFSDVIARNPDNVEIRTVAGTNLVFKPEGKPRGVTDSAKGGFHNAHLIGDRFGGSGKSKALNVYPSSPRYNTEIMGNVENRMAPVLSAKDKFDLTVTAQIKEEKSQGNNLKNLLLSEFEKDNVNATDSDQVVKKELSDKLQTEINKDLKKLPGKFLNVQYDSSEGSFGQIGADPDYEKSVKEFEPSNINT